MTVLQHVLHCDVERLELLAEQAKLVGTDTSGMEPEDKEEHTKRLTAILERLEAIDAT